MLFFKEIIKWKDKIKWERIVWVLRIVEEILKNILNFVRWEVFFLFMFEGFCCYFYFSILELMVCLFWF